MSAVLAKGPLSSALGQWLFVGFGGLYIFAGEKGVGSAAREIAAVAARLAGGGGDLLREAALHSNSTAALQNGSGREHSPQPIIIHSTANDPNKGWTGAILRLSVGAAACWVSYVVFANSLPDGVKELMPVTRRYFEAAVTSLGQGVLHVREALGEQIKALGTKQDAMAKRQDETHDEVRGLREDVGDVQRHIDDIAAAITRCEGALGDAEGRQTYTSRGVGLLVRCVGDLLRSNDPAVAEELDRFQRSSKMIERGDYTDDDRHEHGGGESHPRHKRRHVECDLSEIGSTASTMTGDHRPPRKDEIETLPPSSTKRTPSRSSSLLGISSPPGTLHISFHGHGDRHKSSGHGGDSATAATATSSNASSSSSSWEPSPENEVPQSNDTASDISKDVDVDELLRLVRSGGTGSMGMRT